MGLGLSGQDVFLRDLENMMPTDMEVDSALTAGAEPIKEEMVRIVKTLQNHGAEAVLLGCTELGMLIIQEDATIPVYDTTLLHAHEAASMSFSH